jgi:predicted RecA/RadA family phage recombinase
MADTLELLTRRATLAPATADPEARTVEVVWSTGAPVRRRDMAGPYIERLSLAPEAIAAYSSAEGDPVELSTIGLFQLPKASAAVLTVGARVAWDNTAKEVTTPAAGRFPIGVAVEAAGNGITSVAVRLDGVATAAA